MAWATPRTAVTGEVTTAANLNETRDNLLDLDRRTNAGLAEIATEESTTSGSYGDLTTSGPAVTASVGITGLCVVCLSCRINPTGNQGVMSYAVSGATTISASDTKALYTTTDSRCGVVNVQSGLNAGNNTFTAKYRSNPGGGTASFFSQRTIVAIPLAR